MAGNQKYCPNCGTPHTVETRFCTSCGTKFPESTPSAAPAPSLTPQQQPSSPQRVRSDFITLSCPNCGGRLQITPDVERFACQYCGYEHIVRRSGGVVSLEPVVQMMGQINQGIGMVGSTVSRLSGSAERQASEAAIVRLKEEIAACQGKIAQIHGNGKTTWNVFFVFIPLTVAIFLLASFAVGVYDPLEIFFGIIKWMMVGITFLVFIIAISSAGTFNKQIEEQQAIIRQKEAEMKDHYRIVNQSGSLN